MRDALTAIDTDMAATVSTADVTAAVDAAVTDLLDSAPANLDTLNELAAALGDDANFSATVTAALAARLQLAGGTMTGAIDMGSNAITGLAAPTNANDAATKVFVETTVEEGPAQWTAINSSSNTGSEQALSGGQQRSVLHAGFARQPHGWPVRHHRRF